MKKIYLICLSVIVFYHCASAQKYGWAQSVFSGGTNVFTGFTVDNAGNPVIAGGSEDYSRGPNAFMIQKKAAADGSTMYNKKYSGNNGSRCLKMIVDANNDVYYIGYFYGSIAFGQDTLFSTSKVNWNSTDLMIAKFDAQGNHIWSRHLGTRMEEKGGHFVDAQLVNNKLVMMAWFPADSIFFNNTFIEKVNYVQFRNTYYVVSVNSDGSLDAAKKAGIFQGDAIRSFYVNADGTYNITMDNQYDFVHATISSNGLSVTHNDSIPWRVGSHFDFVDGAYDGRNYYMLITTSGVSISGFPVGNDTLYKLPGTHNQKHVYLVQLDENFKYVKGLAVQWTNTYPTLNFSKGKLIVQTKFVNTIYFNSALDSITARNNQETHALIVLDNSLNILDTFQVNTANASGGSFSFQGAHFDNAGNLYSQYVHNKNVQFGLTVVQAALKSWDHLTVLCKRNGTGGNPTGIKESEYTAGDIILYPNPAADMLNIFSATGILRVTVTDLTGKQLLLSEESKLDISDLSKGYYFVKVETAEGIVVKKLMKQ